MYMPADLCSWLPEREIGASEWRITGHAREEKERRRDKREEVGDEATRRRSGKLNDITHWFREERVERSSF